jgi:hypothetical protein
MSTTPRTDEQVFDWTTEDGSDIVFASFARELETELAAITARAEKAEAALHALRLVCGTSDADKFTTWLNVEIAKREKAEAELANIANAKPDTWGDMSDSFQAWAQNRARHALAAMTARAEKTEADTARLDWLEAHALPQHSPNISISDLGRHFNGFPGSFRAAIDAAMKEASK